MLSSSKFVVGSSRVKIPQFRQNVSARANLIINDARTCESKIAGDENLKRGFVKGKKRNSKKFFPTVSG